MVKYFILFITVFSLFGCEEDSSNPECENNCADYSSQSAAQEAFNADPECHKNLDRDGDNIACE